MTATIRKVFNVPTRVFFGDMYSVATDQLHCRLASPCHDNRALS